MMHRRADGETCITLHFMLKDIHMYDSMIVWKYDNYRFLQKKNPPRTYNNNIQLTNM